MAQAGFTPVQLYHSTTASAAPSSGNLANGELAINITDGKLYYKDNGGVVRVLAGTGGTGVVAGSNTQVQFNNNGVFGASSGLTFDGTTLTANALTVSNATTLSAGTANGVAYLNGSKVLTTGSALTFDGTNLAVSNGSIQVANAKEITWGGVYGAGIPTISASAAAGISFYPSGSTSGEQMRLTSTGLGIGTSSPDQALVVNKASGSTYVKVSGANNVNNDLALHFTDGTNNAYFGMMRGTSGGIAGALHSYTGGAIRSTLDSSGNLGLGVTPSAWGSIAKAIQIGNRASVFTYNNTTTDVGYNAFFSSAINDYAYIASAAASFYRQTGGQHQFYTAPSGTAGNAISFTQAMTLDASGKLLVGTTTAEDFRLVVRGSGMGGILATAPSGYNGIAHLFGINGVSNGYQINCTSGNAISHIWSIGGGAEAARIDSSGNLLVGTTSASAGSRLYVRGSGNTGATYTARIDNSDGSLCFAIEGGGSIFTGTAGDSPYNATTASGANVTVSSNGRLLRSTSSLKYKKNVKDAPYGLADLLKLRSVTYEGKAESDAGKTFGGLIAEEVHDVGLTEFVQYAEDGTPDALAYGNMVSLCIKALQEMKGIVDAQAARIAALEAK